MLEGRCDDQLSRPMEGFGGASGAVMRPCLGPAIQEPHEDSQTLRMSQAGDLGVQGQERYIRAAFTEHLPFVILGLGRCS